MSSKKLVPDLIRDGYRFCEKGHAQTKELEQDDDSKKSHPALVGIRQRAALAFALLVLPAFACAETAFEAQAPVRIEVAARPIAAFDPREPGRVRFGALTFRGGMALTSSHAHFGGVSAIRVDA